MTSYRNSLRIDCDNQTGAFNVVNNENVVIIPYIVVPMSSKGEPAKQYKMDCIKENKIINEVPITGEQDENCVVLSSDQYEDRNFYSGEPSTKFILRFKLTLAVWSKSVNFIFCFR